MHLNDPLRPRLLHTPAALTEMAPPLVVEGSTDLEACCPCVARVGVPGAGRRGQGCGPALPAAVRTVLDRIAIAAGAASSGRSGVPDRLCQTRIIPV